MLTSSAVSPPRPSHFVLFLFFLFSRCRAPLLGLALLATACAFASGNAGYDPESADGAPADASAAESPTEAAPAEPGAEAALSSPVPTGDGDASVAADDATIVCTVCAASTSEDAAPPSATGPSFDAGEGGVCSHPPTSGDLAIVELMIESTSGTGDHGEWIEVASTLGCAINLNGLTGNCPTGAKVATFAVTDDLWIPALGTFVIADSTNAAIDHDLPGPVIPWAGNAGDVLRNAGATVTLLSNGVIVDSVTYPAVKLTTGVSLAFPRDCPATVRSAWTAWQPSIASWFPAFRGSPNAPNDDVHCPALGDE